MDWQIASTLTQKSKPDRHRELLEVLLANRGLSDTDLDDFLNPPSPTPQSLIQSLHLDETVFQAAVQRIRHAISEKTPIVVYGDYDCDGICATAILSQALLEKGALVTSFIPHRTRHGYGLNHQGLKDALAPLEGELPLVITVDNGITALEPIKQLRAQGIDVIITDHHEKPAALPPATHLLHTTALCGSGIAWIVASLLLEKPAPLDLVALATVCDLLPLVGPSRSLVKYGLEQLQRPTRLGLLALYQSANLKPPISAYHLGFVIGPRLNAAGRLADPSDALSLLTTTDSTQADLLAKKLAALNLDRQTQTANHAQQAIEHFQTLDPLPNFLFLAREEFPEGLLGLIASKLVEHFHRPALAVSLSPNLAKGSARSVPGLDITSFLRGLNDQFVSLGGHHQAAGLSFLPGSLSQIQTALDRLSLDLSADLFIKKLRVDAALTLDDLDFDLLNLLDHLEPFGIGNPRPLFTTTLPISASRLIGADQTHLKLALQPPYTHLDVVGFNLAPARKFLHRLTPAVFSLGANTYNQKTSLQLLLKDIKREDASI